MTRIKVCGLTRLQDVKTAVKLGIDCLGFILAESPRQISLKQAQLLTENLPPFVSSTGVLVNPTPEKLQEVIQSNIFDYLQFHGEEDPQILDNLPVKTIKAFSIAVKEDLKAISAYRHADFFLFDTRTDSQRGGTGQKFDWEILNKVYFNKSFILAGGLGPENITDALCKVNPAAVDLNSQIEDKPGIKNKKLLENVVVQIRNYDSGMITKHS